MIVDESSQHWPEPAAEERSAGSMGARRETSERDRYAPEPVYFEDAAFPTERAARLTALCVARWATEFEAMPMHHPEAAREGALPRTAAARGAVVGEALDAIQAWIAAADLPFPHHARLFLLRGGRIILAQGDAIPADALFLTPREFAALQACWEQHGLPRDLYYPAELARRVIEPVEAYGGVFLAERVYSPRQWERHIRAPAAPPRLPSDEERREAFVQACQTFHNALHLREQQLIELQPAGPVVTPPVRTYDPEEVDELRAARLWAILLMDRARGEDVRPMKQAIKDDLSRLAGWGDGDREVRTSPRPKK